MRKLYINLIIILILINQSIAKQINDTFDLSVKQVPITNLVENLAIMDNIDIITDDNIQGNISLKLSKTTLPDLLNIIAKTKNLKLSHDKNIFYLSSYDKVDKTIQNSTDNIKLLTKPIHIKHHKSEDIIKMLVSDNSNLLSPSGKLANDSLGNNIIMQDTIKSISNIQKLLNN